MRRRRHNPVKLLSTKNAGYVALVGAAFFGHAASAANESAMIWRRERDKIPTDGSASPEERQENANRQYSALKDETIQFATIAAIAVGGALLAFHVVKL